MGRGRGGGGGVVGLYLQPQNVHGSKWGVTMRWQKCVNVVRRG